MRLWAEVYTAAGVHKGMVNLASANVTRQLDKAGSIKIEVSIADPKSALLEYGRWVYLYTDWPHGKRFIEKGILQKESRSFTTGDKRLRWTCSDGLVALQRENTGRGLIYDGVSIEYAVSDLISKVSGWTVIFDNVSGTTGQRFEGISILEALTKIATSHGLHFRAGIVENQIVFGAMGSDSGLRVTNLRRNVREVWANENVALIEKLDLTIDGYEVVNWIEPISGPVDGALTLKRSTKTSPYTILQTTINGKTAYYLTDTDSVAAYGTIKKVLSPRSLVVAVAPSTQAYINAADVLYDWAAKELQRRSQPQKAYGLSAMKLTRPVYVGEKLDLFYQGALYQKNHDGSRTEVRAGDVDESLYILKLSEDYDTVGASVDFEVSNIDVRPQSAMQMLADTALDYNNNRISVTISVNRSTVNGTLTLAYDTPDTINFTVKESTISITACLVTVTRALSTGPDTISMYLDDVEITGGPWLQGETWGNTFTVDIADAILGSVILQGEHVLEIRALYNPGDLDVIIELFEVIAGVA